MKNLKRKIEEFGMVMWEIIVPIFLIVAVIVGICLGHK